MKVTSSNDRDLCLRDNATSNEQPLLVAKAFIQPVLKSTTLLSHYALPLI
jgi:hypothetical protein